MNTPNSTAPAAVDTKLVGELVDASRDKAMEKAGESEARVSAIQDIQKEEVKQLLGGADGNTSGAEQLIAAAEQEIADEHAERMTTIKDTPDAYSMRIPAETGRTPYVFGRFRINPRWG
jgi:hypothetical protein